MKNIFILIFFILSISFTVNAETYSMRDCTLLPIVTDKTGDSLGYKTFEGVERYLKSINWCRYKPSSKLLGIFSKYRERLGTYLEDQDVLKTVSSRLAVGSMFKVSLKNNIKTLEIELKVFGENGKDLYLEEKSVIDKVSIPLAIETIISWLKLYEANIPYDAKVLGVLGDQITIDFGKTYSVVVGQEFKVSRNKGKVSHPLLKKIVSWDTVNLANGKIFNISKNQALGVLKLRTNRMGVEQGDWVKLEKAPIKRPFDPTKFNKNSSHKFGRLGELELFGIVSSSEVSSIGGNGSTKQSGLIYGLQARAEAWITREYFAMGEYTKKFGSIEKSSGSPASSSINVNTTVMKIGGGFKYLPLGFFYGPQLNVYGGYASYQFTLESSATDGYGSNTISGLMVGVHGSMPLQKGVRLNLRAEILPFAKFEDESGTFGNNQNTNCMKLEVGGSYKYSHKLTMIGGVESLTNGARFSGTPGEINYNETVFKLGAALRF